MTLVRAHSIAPAPVTRSLADGRRVLLVTEAASAGVGRHVIDLAGQLIACGLDVHLAYSRRRQDVAFQRGLELPGLTSRVIDMRRNPHPSDATALRSLVRYAREHGPFDLVHGHSSKGGALTRLAARRLGVPSVYTPHCLITMNPGLHRLAFHGFRCIESWLARRTGALIAVSPGEHAHMLELGFPAERVHCVQNGISAPPAATSDRRRVLRDQLQIPAGAQAVGFLGRMSPQKDPVLAVEAFADLRQRGTNAHLVMAGDGPLLEDARRRARDLQVDAHVAWPGSEDGAALLPAFDLFLLSSAYEGMPYVLLEALAAGLPIATTDVGGARDTVTDGDNGFVVPVHRAPALADAMHRVLADPALRCRMADRARDRAREFSLPAMARHTLDVYDRLAPVTGRAMASDRSLR